MTFLLIALFFSICIMVTFKLFPRFGINITQAITTNYLICSVLGFLTLKQTPSTSFYIDNEWFYVALASGIFLILVFNVFALSAEKAGVAITAVSSKMSVVIPVLMGALIFGERLPALKIIGVVLVIISFYLIFRKGNGYKIKAGLILLPLLLFLGNGTNDTILKYAQYNHITSDQGYVKYLTVAFGVSFTLGILILTIRTFIKKDRILIKNLLAGIWLGTCNWFSTLFFLKGLGAMDVSVFIPVFNAGLVSLTALIGLLIFRERLNKVNILGIGISIVAITIIAYANG